MFDPGGTIIVVVYLLVEVGFVVGRGLHEGGGQDLILKPQKH